MCYILLKSLFRLIENILRMKKKFSFIIVFLCAVSVWGQTQVKKEQLQKQNAELKKQIEEINKNLAKTKSEAKLSLAYLNEINKKIDLREKVYGNTQKQKRILEDDIYLKQLEINRQEKELKTLRKNYSKVLVKAYKNKGVQNKVTFILSSKNIGEAVRRMQYLKSYSDFQDKKAAEIQGVSNQIKKTIVAKQKSVKDKNELLNTQKKELVTIGEERKEKEKLLEEFRKNEAKLTAEIRQKQKESKLLEAKIRSIIIEEAKIAKAKEEAERKAKEEKIRLAKIAAEKEKARIEAENRKKLEEAAREKAKAEVEARRLAEIERKRLEEVKRLEELERRKAEELERKRQAEIAAEKEEAIRLKKQAELEVEKAKIRARNEEKRLAAEKEAKAAEESRKLAEAKLAEKKKAEVEITKKQEEEKKQAEEKAFEKYGANVAIGSNFANNRGRLMFPVNGGTITHRFGKQPHPVFKNIMEENIGIKISVGAGAVAKCVFTGEVSKILIEGNSKTVMVRHGSYFTVYSNLASVSVSAGQKVSEGTPIGVVAKDYDGSYTLDFQVWDGRNPLDPMGWISR